MTGERILLPCRKKKPHEPHTWRKGKQQYRCVGVGLLTEDQLAELAFEVLKGVVKERAEHGTRYKDLPQEERERVSEEMADLFSRFVKGQKKPPNRT